MTTKDPRWWSKSRKHDVKSAIAFVALLCVGLRMFAANVSLDSMILAERGKSATYVIVIPEKSSPSQKYAAEELRDFMEKATGVRLSVITDAARMSLPGKAILLGGTRWTTKLAGCGGDIGTDGFRLVARPPHLLVIGSPDRGTLYGVYELLERFAGCRWYASWHSVIPRRQRMEVPADLDNVQIPAFAMREPYWYDVTGNPAFAARLRVNSRSWKSFDEKYGGNPYRFGGGLGSCHTFESLLPQKKYFDAHPEYYSMINGKRVRGKTQLCLTNPDVLRIVTSNVLARIRADPGAKFYGVSQEDNSMYCRCPVCKAVDDEEGSPSGTIVRFVNAVAEAVEKEFPDVIIETLAYSYSQKAPMKTKLRHNVMPCLCSIGCDFAQPIDKSPFKANIAFRKDIEDWGRQTDFLYIWDYTTDFTHYTMPWPNVYALQGNVQFFRRNNVKALFEQGAYQGRHADFAELKAWLLAKWMWNPDLPIKPLLDDFFAGYYGKAAPFVRDYFERIHRLQVTYSSQPNHPLKIFDGAENPAIPDSFLKKATSLWDKAIAAVEDDAATFYNVRMAKFSFDYVRMERSRKLLNLSTKNPVIPSEAAKGLARSLLDRMAEAKDIRLSLEPGLDQKLRKTWNDIAETGMEQICSEDGELEDCHVPLKEHGTWGDYVEDFLAGDGKAMKLFNTHSEWCVQLPMDKIAFDPGVKYRLSVRVRVDKALDGEAFCAGVYSKSTKRCVGTIHPRTEGMPDGEYRWYDVLDWVPTPDEYFWMSPGRFNADGKSAIDGVYLDKIKFTINNKKKKESAK